MIFFTFINSHSQVSDAGPECPTVLCLCHFLCSGSGVVFVVSIPDLCPLPYLRIEDSLVSCITDREI